MATQTERTVVYAAGVVQGIALVTFPAASTILTDPSEYDLSSTQYGALFLPQVITAITAALLGAGLSGRFGTKRIYLVGLTASLVSMAILLVSSLPDGRPGARIRTVARRHRLPRRRLRLRRAGSQHLHRGVQPWRGRPLDPRAQRATRAGNGACSRLRRDLRRARILVGSSSDRRRIARRPDRGQPASSAAGRSHPCHEGIRAARDPATVLGIRVLRRPLRHLRDRQRQLVATRHDERARCVHHASGSCAHGVLGDGDSRTGLLRRCPARLPAQADVPRPAVRARRGICAHLVASR